MTTVRVNIPIGLERVVLTLDEGEVQKLRERLQDVEVCCDIGSVDRWPTRVALENKRDPGAGGSSVTSEIRPDAGGLPFAPPIPCH